MNNLTANNAPIAIADYLNNRTPCDTPRDKVDKYYNKHNKYNKENKNNDFASHLCATPSSASPLKDTAKDIDTATHRDRDTETGLALSEEKDSVSASNPELGWQTAEDVEQAVIQYYVNPRTRKQKKETRNLKCQIKSKADGYIDFVARLSTSITSIKRFGDNVSEAHQQQVVQQAKALKEKILFEYPGSKVYMGKFKEAGVWTDGKSSMGAIEEGTLGIVWYDHSANTWRYFIMFQHWVDAGAMTKDLSEKQKGSNMIAQHIYYPAPKMKNLSRTERRRQKLLAEGEA